MLKANEVHILLLCRNSVQITIGEFDLVFIKLVLNWNYCCISNSVLISISFSYRHIWQLFFSWNNMIGLFQKNSWLKVRNGEIIWKTQKVPGNHLFFYFLFLSLATFLVCSVVLGKNPAWILLNWRFLTRILM